MQFRFPTAVTLAAVLALGVAACGDTANEGAATPPAATEPAPAPAPAPATPPS